MSGITPASVLYSSDGYELSVVTNTTIPTGTRALLVAGSDGTNARPVLVDSSGREIVVGAGTAGSPSGGVLSIQGVASGTAVTISGTVTANIGTTNGLALDTTLAKLTISQGTALGTNTQVMVGGSVSTGSPTYTNGNINPFSLTTAGALRVDSSATTQPVSGTVVANAGTGNFTIVQATAANLNATIVGTTAAGSGASSGLVTVQGNASGTPIPISGTVTATNPSVSSTAAAPPASATYIAGSVTTAAPTYTTGQMNALSLTTGGLLRVDASGTTQTISGTVAATQSGTWNITNISGTVSLPTGAATEATLSAINTKTPTLVSGRVPVETTAHDVHDLAAGTDVITIGAYASSTAPTAVSTAGDSVRLWSDLNGRLAIWDGASTISIDDGAGSITVDGTVAATQSGTWNITNISGTVSLPTGAATETTLSAINTKTPALVSGRVPVETTAHDIHDAVAGTDVITIGAYASSTAPTAVSANGDSVRLWSDLNGRLAVWDGGTTFSIDDGASSITVDGSVTVSGTVTANQGTANTAANAWFIKNTDGTNTAAVKAASTAPIATDPALVVAISPNSSLNIVTDKCATGTVTSVAASVTSVNLLASNTNRVLATIFNESTGVLYLKLGSTASLTSYTIRIFPGSYWELPASYTGAIDGIWNVANGFARITELT